MDGADASRSPNGLSLEADERVLLRADPSRNLLLAAFGLAFVLLVGMSLLIGSVGDLGTGRLLSGLTIALVVGTVLFAYVTIRRHQYVLTNRRAYVVVGMVSPSVSGVDHDRIADVVVEQSGWQRWVSTGDVRFVPETGDQELRFAFVDEPRRVRETVLTTLEGRRRAAERE